MNEDSKEVVYRKQMSKSSVATGSELNLPTSQQDSHDRIVVGIGASAGGLEALESLLQNLSPHTGASFIIIQHLSPDFGSVMDQLLARHTSMPVKTIVDAMTLESNTIYLLPPSKEVILSNRRLFLTDRSILDRLNFPIDEFFRSLAKDAGNRSIGVILSGTGSDGSRGILDIHTAQGTVIVQSESTATFNGMPRSALNTGVVDLVLSPPEIAKAILRICGSPTKRPSVQSEEPLFDKVELPPAIRNIVLHLKNQFALDLDDYKFPMMMRRLERRSKLCGINDLESYYEHICHDELESNRLYHDMLIGVTGFFRDKEVFDRLELDVLPTLIGRLKDEEEFRCWVAGVATGEEAYSIGILLAEVIEKAGRGIRARIFASDIHETSLAFAGRGIYPEDRLDGVTPERRARFFIERQDGVHVGPELRKMVVFTPHNVMRDPPFTRLDLISCRNLLIYFNPKTQQKAISLFHFGLKSGGVLCLGQSESLGELRNEFQSIDEASRIYRKHREFSPSSAIQGIVNTSVQSPFVRSQTELSNRRLIRVYDHLLNRYMAPAILVNCRFEVQHVFGNAGRFLVVPNGRPASSILDIIHPELRSTLALVLHPSVRSQEPVLGNCCNCKIGDSICNISITSEIVDFVSDSDFSLLIRIVQETKTESHVGVSVAHPTNDESKYQQIERELQFTRDSLQATIEQLQFVNEQLQAANEELTSSNEELQSTNEELHSVNEELYTVNAEHQRKIDELTDLNDDIDNLLSTSNVHTLFLDSNLCLRRFTPRATEIFNIIPQDIGRSINSFSHALNDNNISHSIRDAINTERTVEREVQSQNGHWFLLSIFPYLSRGKVDGAVVTLVDVTSLKDTAEALRNSEKRFDLAVRGSSAGIWDWSDVNQERIWCSDRLYTLLGRTDSQQEMTTSLWKGLIHPDDVHRADKALIDHLERDIPYDIEYRLECVDGCYKWFHVRGAAERNALGVAIRMSGSLEDVTDRRRAEEAVQIGVKRRDQFLAMLSHELRNPLGAIANAAALLSQVEERSERHTNAIQVLHRQIRQMTRLMDDLLDVSRITHGKIELQRRVVDIVSIARHAISVAESTLMTSGVTLSFVAPPRAVMVYGDPSRLEQVIVNLLNNVAKYTMPGGQSRFEIEVKDEQRVVLRITDSGVGIPADRLEEIFTLFFQSDLTLDRTKGGMGVGLTLVKSIVELHGGKVCAMSEGVGKGSCFVVELPICHASPIEAPLHRPIQSSSISTIAIVEDIEDSREMLAELLELRGYRVHRASNGIDGLEMILAHLPDLAIIDIGLPGLDGLKVASELRADPRTHTMKLIALTGYGQTRDCQRIKESGFDLHLVKPLDPFDLEELLVRLSSSKQCHPTEAVIEMERKNAASL